MLYRQLENGMVGRGGTGEDTVVLFGTAIHAWAKSDEVEQGVRVEALLDLMLLFPQRAQWREARGGGGFSFRDNVKEEEDSNDDDDRVDGTMQPSES